MPIRVVEAREESDKQAIYRFLAEVRAGEFEDGHPWEAPGQDSLDSWAHHYMALDDAGTIAGSIRFNALHEGGLPPELAERLGVGELLEAFAPQQISFTSRLEIAPHKRGHTVASRLAATVIQRMLRQGVLVDLTTCSLDLVHMHYQLGYRPYLPAFRLPHAGVHQPLALCPRDLEHLVEVESPAASLVPPDLDDDGQTALTLRRVFPEFRDPGFDRVSTRALWARLARSTLSAGLPGLGLLEGFEAHELELIAPHVARQYFMPGQFVYRRGERQPGMGVVLSGSLGVVLAEAGNHVLAVLGPSEPFGELQALGPGERSADVVALERSEVLLLPPNFVDRVGRVDPELGFRLAQRLLQVLGQRLVAANRELLSMGRSSSNPARSRRPAVHAVAPDASELAPTACFAVEQLSEDGDRVRGLSLLSTAIGTVELPALLAAGLADGQAVLDMAAGDGVFACTLARRLPGCQLVGLDADSERRALADGLAVRQGYSDRCRFLDAPPELVPLPDDSVDFCYARKLLQRAADPAVVLAEMLRVTRPGGIVCALDVDDQSVIVHPAADAWALLRERLERAAAITGGHRHIGRRLPGLLRAAGLEGVHTTVLTVTPADLGTAAFMRFGFGVVPPTLQRARLWDSEACAAMDAIQAGLATPDGFASFSGFLVHGLVP